MSAHNWLYGHGLKARRRENNDGAVSFKGQSYARHEPVTATKAMTTLFQCPVHAPNHLLWEESWALRTAQAGALSAGTAACSQKNCPRSRIYGFDPGMRQSGSRQERPKIFVSLLLRLLRSTLTARHVAPHHFAESLRGSGGRSLVGLSRILSILSM